MLFHNFINLLHSAVGGSSPSNKHNVVAHSLRKTRQKEAIRLPNYSASPVAVMRLANFFTGGYANAIKAQAVFSHIGHQWGADRAFFSIKPSEFMVLVQRNCLLQLQNTLSHAFVSQTKNRNKGHTDKRCDLDTLVREHRSALCTTAGEYLATVSRFHSLAETMFLFTLKLLRLVGSYHRKPLLSGKPCRLLV